MRAVPSTFLQDQIAVLKAAQAAPAAAVESPVRLQILVADAAPAASEQAQQLAALQEQLLFLQSKVAALAAAATAAPATPALLAASTSEDLAAYAAATSAERTLAVVQTQQQEVLQSVQELQQQLGLLAARTDALALVQQQQQEAIQEASAAPAAAAVPAEPPSPATAQTRAAAASSVSASPSSKQLSSLAAAGQGQFLVRLVEVVKRQSSRLRSQYADSEADVGGALAQVSGQGRVWGRGVRGRGNNQCSYESCSWQKQRRPAVACACMRTDARARFSVVLPTMPYRTVCRLSAAN